MEKYLLEQLSEAEKEAFEQHYFECARCFEELQTYRALQVELRRLGPPIGPGGLRSFVGWPWAWGAAAAVVLLAVGLGLWMRRPERRAQLSPLQAVAPTPQAHQPPPAPLPSLSELAQVQPPQYTPTTLRGATDEATEHFREAMQHYLKGDYAGAIPGLRAAFVLNPRAANISFFLGICYLLSDQTDAAIKQLRTTVALGDSPYLEEAHFYLAKGYLRKGVLGSAQVELTKTIQLHGNLESEAQRLLGQLQTLSTTPR